MRLLIYSDLHLEFPKAREGFSVPHNLDFDAVVLAGDIDKHTKGILWAASCPAFKNKKIFYVLGNHEAWGAHLYGLIAEMRRVAKDVGVIFLECDEYIDWEHNVRFLGTVLFTDFQLFGLDSMNFCMKEAAKCMPDFSTIRVGKSQSLLLADRFGLTDSSVRRGEMNSGILTPMDTVKFFNRSKSWLAEKLAEPFDGKTVVITHHLPSALLVADRFKKDPLSAAFASHVDDLVAKVDGVWACGHTHDSFDLRMGTCRVVVNPRGYPNSFKDTVENSGFRDDLVVEI